MKKIILMLILFELITCKTNFDNNSDPASSSYLSKYMMHGVFVPAYRKANAPTILKNKYKTIYFVINQNFATDFNSTNFSSNALITSYSITPPLPSGIRINNNGSITIDGSNGPTKSTALIKYTVSGCNVGGCATTDIDIQVANIEANFVYGQSGLFTSGVSNAGGISASSLSFPKDMVVDSTGGLYIADTGNTRVLYFPQGQTTATRVYGQGATGTNFTSSNTNFNTVSNTTLSSRSVTETISGMALDSFDNLYVVDTGANRVLRFPSGSVTANLVYGQSNFTTFVVNGPGIALGLNIPISVALDSNNGLYISDSGNNRVLYYNFNNTNPVRVYGQGGVFTTSTANKNPNSNLDNLNKPGSIFVSKDILYVLDTLNSRVISYSGVSTTSNYKISKSSAFQADIDLLQRIYIDSSEGIFYSRTYFNSEFWLKSGDTTLNLLESIPSYSFSNDSSTTINNKAQFFGSIILDSQKRVYISDRNNNRVLRFDASE